MKRIPLFINVSTKIVNFYSKKQIACRVLIAAVLVICTLVLEFTDWIVKTLDNFLMYGTKVGAAATNFETVNDSFASALGTRFACSSVRIVVKLKFSGFAFKVAIVGRCVTIEVYSLS